MLNLRYSDLSQISGPFSFDPKWIDLEVSKIRDLYFKRNLVENVKVHKHCDGLTIHVIVTMKSKRTHDFKFDVPPEIKMQLTIDEQLEFINANYEALMERIRDPRDVTTIKVKEKYASVNGTKITSSGSANFEDPIEIYVKFSEPIKQRFDWNNKFVNRIKPTVTYNNGMLANNAIIGFNCTDDPYIAKINIDPKLILIHSDGIYKFTITYPVGAFCKLESANSENYDDNIISPEVEFEITLTKE